MSSLNRQPPRVPMVDPKTGLITREWDRFFSDTFTRLGGAEAPTNNELDIAMPEDSGVAELEMFTRGLDTEFSQIPIQQLAPIDSIWDQAPTVQLQVMAEVLESMQSEIRSNAEMIATLIKQVEELKQGTML